MTDERAAEGVEHLQAAARELLAAARAFLDVVEDVVEDRGRLTEAAAVVSEVVRDGLGRRGAPFTAAWPASGAAGEPGATDRRGEPAGDPGADTAGAGARDEDLAAGRAGEDEGATVTDLTDAAASRDAGTRTAGARATRVRRIPVD